MHIGETGNRAGTRRAVRAGNVIPRAIATSRRLRRAGIEEYSEDYRVPEEGWRDAILEGVMSASFEDGEAM